jgi:glycosyltransferase involved in cell wall biosynthesis
LVTDAFPPVCGGSGWSTWEVARGLRARGHAVVVAQPVPGAAGVREREHDGFRVVEIGAARSRLPFVATYFRNERLWPIAAEAIGALARREGADLLHGQHTMSCPAAVVAGEALDVPVVCTIRDYWPVCYWSTLIHDYDAPALCPGCSTRMMTRCVRPRAGTAWPLALASIPYMQANLRRKRTALAGADALVAVSTTMAEDLRTRAPELRDARIDVIPNPVDVTALRRARDSRAPLAGEYLVYVGKLERNKGVEYLVDAVRRAPVSWPFVVVGDGAERAAVERAAGAAGRETRFTGWIEREAALAWLAHAALLVFPSRGPESLSRVLLEAAALGVPIAAMDTGGTRDIVRDGETGLLVGTAVELAEAVGRLAADAPLRRRLAAAATVYVRDRFDTPRVAERLERLYTDLLAARASRHGRARA